MEREGDESFGVDGSSVHLALLLIALEAEVAIVSKVIVGRGAVARQNKRRGRRRREPND